MIKIGLPQADRTPATQMNNGSTFDHPFSADRPIGDRSEDRLGRRGFAETLAHAVRQWRGSDSLVIALYGPWGSGKSSVKNMVLDTLAADQQGAGRPLVVEFNPWQFANRDQLTEAFFREVGVGLGRQEGATQGDRKRLASRWRAYAAYLQAGASFIDVLRGPIFWGLLALAVALAGASMADIRTGGFLLAGGLVLFAALLRGSSKFAEAVAQAIRTREEANRKTLKEVKEEIANDLRTLPAPLLVVMDDVDRLAAMEVQQLFQLVKANADFPNLVYLLLFQREVVEQSVEKLSPGLSGRDFLEKIVQVGFDIPTADQQQLDKILFEGLDKVLTDAAIERHFDKQRWGNLFIGGLQPYFGSLRNVHRFLSTLSFHFGLFRGERSFEVNPIDLIGLEVLRLFEPNVYRAIARNKKLLTEGANRDSRGTDEEKRRAIHNILEDALQERRDSVREIMTRLFPRTEWAFGGTNYGPDFEEQWFRDLRVCSPEVFDRYFQFAIPEGDISQSALDRLLTTVGDREALRAELRELAAQDLLGVAMDRLEAYKETISLEHAVPFITALLDAGEDLPADRSSFFRIGPDMHAIRVIYWYLRREQDGGRRDEVLRTAIRDTGGLYLPVKLISVEDDREERGRDPAQRLVTDAALAELRQLCVGRIRAAAAEGRLSTHPLFNYLLYRWREWADVEEARAFSGELTQTPEGAIHFVTGFLQRGTSFGATDFVGRERWYIRLENLEDFVRWEAIEERLQTVQLDSLSDRERQAVEAFRLAVQRRRRGLPPDDE